MPKRIQASRKAGYRQHDNAYLVARPSRWGNPYRVTASNGGTFIVDDYRLPDKRTAHAYATALYEADLVTGHLPYSIDDVVRLLADADLACWCPPDLPCHADVLLAYANPQETP